MKNLLELLQGKRQEEEQMFTPMEQEVEQPMLTPAPMPLAQQQAQQESAQADAASVQNFLQNPIGRQMGDERAIPFRPDTEPQAEDEELLVNPQTKEEGKEVIQDIKKMETSANKDAGDLPKGETKDQKMALLEELREARKLAEQEVKSGRNVDAISGLLNSITSGFSQINRANAMRNSLNPNIKAIEPVQLQTDAGKNAMADSQARLKNITDEINQRRAVEEDEASIELAKQKMTQEKAPMSEFDKAQSKKFADASVEYFAKDRSQLVNNLDKVETALKTLESGADVSGTLIGNTPDSILSAVNEKAVATKEAMQSAIQDTLRPTLGAQFTEKEGERIMNLAFNPRLSEKENAKRAKRLADYIKAKVKANDALYDHLSKGGTMSNFDKSIFDLPNTILKESENLNKSSGVPSDRVKIQFENGDTGTILKSKLSDFLAKYPNAKVLE